MVLDSGCMLESPGELVKDSQSQGVKSEPLGGGSGFCIFSRNPLGNSNSHPGLRPTERSTNISAGPRSMAAGKTSLRVDDLILTGRQEGLSQDDSLFWFCFSLSSSVLTVASHFLGM